MSDDQAQADEPIEYPDYYRVKVNPKARVATITKMNDRPRRPPGTHPRNPKANAARSARRRRATVINYCVANDITRLLTLTFAEATFDLDAVFHAGDLFVRGLHRRIGAE